MLFNSFTYLVFFVVVVIGYFLLPQRFRWVLLLAASYIFYMAWKPELIVLIVFSTFCNYAVSLKISRTKRQKKRKRLLVLSLVINFGLLLIFKYLVFFNNTFIGLFGTAYPIKPFEIVLPMGISFYTFQAAAYTIDVYRGRIQPERHYGIFSLFITFFPQLVAGPIERSENLLPQFYEKHRFQLENVVAGAKIMLWGYFKKIVIADRVATAVNTVYNNPGGFKGLSFLIATLLFAFQIYCDFSGYSDIAQGSAKVLGFRLMDNFKKPYLTTSIRQFWRQWHISLSGWFMDYVYIPLGGNREGRLKKYRNLMVTFLVSGLWHGANWTFVLWGACHGAYQIIGSVTAPFRQKLKSALRLDRTPLPTIIGVIVTFGLVTVAWVFFRANTAADAFYILRHLPTGWRLWTNPQYLYEVLLGLGLNLYELKMVLIALAVLVLAELVSGRQSVFAFFEDRPYIIRLAFYVLIAVIILSMGVFHEAGAFIYFQF